MRIDKQAHARWRGGKDGDGRIASGSGALDAIYSVKKRFTEEAGTNPEELIAAAHAGCFAMALAIELEKAGHTATSLDVSAKVTLESEGQGFRITRSALRLEADVPDIGRDDMSRIANAAKAGCPVSKVLNAEITLEIIYA